MNKSDYQALTVKVHNFFGEDYQVVGWITGREGEPEWELVERRKRAPQKIDKLKYKNESTKKIEKLEINETERIIGIKNKDTIYYASEYPVRSIAIKNTLNGKIMLISSSFKFVNKRGNTTNSKAKEQGIIRNV